MTCETCHGIGEVIVPGPSWAGMRPLYWLPCPDCGGCGVAHCCEGERAQPETPCDIAYADRAPEPGVDSCGGLGWDWDWDAPDTNTPPVPGRGIFALGADAGLVMALRNAAPALIAALRENERLRVALRETKAQLEHVFGLLASSDRELWAETAHVIERANAALGDAL